MLVVLQTVEGNFAIVRLFVYNMHCEGVQSNINNMNLENR